MTFKPIYDLESLSEAQRQEYYLAACEYYGIPAELNALAFIWMDSHDGKRNLTLYAKKAATDIIRANRGISTIRLTKDVGQGYVAWIAEGRDSSGRTEIAAGTASTEGLKGQALAMQVMLAQTRATRRMTLQFVGGLLDESELPSTVTDIGRSGASLASLATLPAPPQPAVQPNTDAGKDITQELGEHAPSSESNLAVDVLQWGTPNPNRKRGYGVQNPPKEGVSLQSIAPTPFLDGNITPKTVETVEQVAEPKKRRRRTKAEINFDSAQAPVIEPVLDAVTEHLKNSQTIAEIAEQVVPPSQMNIPTAESAKQALREVAAKMPATVVPEPAQERIQTTVFPPAQFAPIPTSYVPSAPTEEPNVAIAPQVIAQMLDPDMPSEAEEKAWRARLSVYTNDILPKGGMRKEDGIIWKIRKYVQKMFPELPVKNGTMKLNNTQWQKVMNDLDETLRFQGAAGLVEYLEAVAAQP
jgi:hypothetical protein